MITEFYPMSIESAVSDNDRTITIYQTLSDGSGNKVIFSHEQWTSIRNTIDNIIERDSKTTNENQD